MTVQSIDTAALRRAIYGRGPAQRADLAALLSKGAEAGDEPGFLALVADVARDALVADVDPPGYVSEADSQWLMGEIGASGGLGVPAGKAALKAVIGHAVSVPAALTGFAVRELAAAILKAGDGVTRADVEALRLFAFAPTAGAPMHVDQASAQALFDIAHATAAARNDPEFADFFAKAVGNFLIGAVFLTPASREEELALERALDAPISKVSLASGFSGGAFSGQGAVGRRSYENLTDDIVAAENDETDARLAAAADVDADKARWIVAHLSRDGDLTAPEKRLLAFLRDEAASAPREIVALYAKAA